MDPTTGFVNASNAVGQPFFAHVPPSFMHQPSPGMNYMPSAGIRHPAVQHQVFLQQHPHQGHVMLPLGQMPHGPYPDNTIYYGILDCFTSVLQNSIFYISWKHFSRNIV